VSPIDSYNSRDYMDFIHCCERRTTEDWDRPIDIGNGIESQKDEQKGGDICCR